MVKMEVIEEKVLRVRGFAYYKHVFIFSDGSVKYGLVDAPKTFKSLEHFENEYYKKFKVRPEYK